MCDAARNVLVLLKTGRHEFFLGCLATKVEFTIRVDLNDRNNVYFLTDTVSDSVLFMINMGLKVVEKVVNSIKHTHKKKLLKRDKTWAGVRVCIKLNKCKRKQLCPKAVTHLHQGGEKNPISITATGPVGDQGGI